MVVKTKTTKSTSKTANQPREGGKFATIAAGKTTKAMSKKGGGTPPKPSKPSGGSKGGKGGKC